MGIAEHVDAVRADRRERSSNSASARLGILVLDAPGSRRNAPARVWSAPAFEVRAATPVHAGIDGEAVDLDALVRFQIRPAALRVRISSRHPGVSPSGRLPTRRPHMRVA